MNKLTTSRPHFLLLLTGAILAVLIFASSSFAAIIDQPMTGPTAPGWILGGTPNPAILTGDDTIDPNGDGWLRLTNATGNQAGYAYLDTPFSITTGVVIQFDYTTWGGNGADGYSIFLFDALTTPFQIGASGGSLGYAQKTVAPISPGLSGGYIGIGIDEYGNFSNPTEGRVGGPGQLPNSVAIRGPSSTSWAYLGGSAANVGQLWFNQATRPTQTGADYRKVVIFLTPVAAPNFMQIDVYLQFGYNQPLTPVALGVMTGQPIPANVKVGYAASTGGSTNYHEIRNLLVNPLSNEINLAMFKESAISTINVGDPISYTLTARNYGPNFITGTDVPVTDTIPAEITGVNWTCAGVNGATCAAASGSGNNLNTSVTLPFNSEAIYTINGTLSTAPATNTLSNTATIDPAGATPPVNDYNNKDDSDTLDILVNSDLSTSTKTVVDLNGGNADPGDTLRYTITLPETAGGAASSVQVTDDIPTNVNNFTVVTIPAGATDNSTGSGTGVNGNGYLDITDITVPALGSVSIVFDVDVNGPIGGTIDNTATITNPAGAGATPSAPTVNIGNVSDLSSSFKDVVDVNGSDTSPDDVLRYTITLNESSGNIATASVTDNIPANVNTFTLISFPAGAINNSTGSGTGANGTGYLDLSNVTVPANGSVDIVFDVTIDTTAAPGTLIDNTATVSNLAGPGASPVAPTVSVSASSLPTAGNKQLYLYGAGGYELSRTPTPGAPAFVTIPKNGASQTWNLTPVLQSDMTLDPAINPNIPVNLYTASNRNTNITANVTLSCSSGGTGAPPNQELTERLNTTPEIYNPPFQLPLTSLVTCPAGSWWQLTIQNNNTQNGQRDLRIYPVNGTDLNPGIINGDTSQVILPSQDVINVDSVGFFNDSWTNGGTAITSAGPGDTVWIQTNISDPFGSADISGATLDFDDAVGTPQISGATMSEVPAAATAATKTYEYSYVMPGAPAAGFWDATVTAAEGTEGTITHTGTASISVPTPVSNLSNSTKEVVDLNGGDAEPGDTLRYTINIIETGGGAASNVQVTDTIPANVNNFTIVSLPVGAVDNSNPTGGANGTGFLNIDTISVPANSTVSIIFDVTINAGTPAGTQIDNAATIFNPGGSGGTPVAESVIVSASTIPASGNKQLYLGYNPYPLTRTPTDRSTPGTYVTIPKNNSSQAWTLGPALTADVTIDPAISPNVPVNLYMASNQARTITATVELSCSSGGIGGPISQQLSEALDTTPELYTPPFTLPLGTSFTCPAGSSWILTITNNTGGGGARDLRVYPVNTVDLNPGIVNGDISQVILPSQDVINVNTVTFYDDSYTNGGTQITSVNPGDTISIRADVSDPFGSFDISGAILDLDDSGGTPVLTSVGMAMVNEDVPTGVKTYEYIYTVPVMPPLGFWTASVTAAEGTEGTVTDTTLGSFAVVGPPVLTILKSADLANANPGQVITYTITVNNTGGSPATTVQVDDALSPYINMILDYDGTTPPYEAFDFTDGGSGLTFDEATDLTYFDSGGPYVPNYPAGEDGNVVAWQLDMNGSFNAGSQFTLRFKVRVK